jgi:hypothetical protein
MSTQGGQGLQCDSVVQQGGTLNVEVGPNDSEVEVSAGDDGSLHPVTAGKTTPIPVPPVPPGTILSIRVGKGLRARVIYVEVIAPFR